MLFAFYLHLLAILGKDYVGLPSSLTFIPGQLIGALSCINITIITDGIVEEKENFAVILLTNFPGVHVSRAKSVIEIIDGDGDRGMYTEIVVRLTDKIMTLWVAIILAESLSITTLTVVPLGVVAALLLSTVVGITTIVLIAKNRRKKGIIMFL